MDAHLINQQPLPVLGRSHDVSERPTSTDSKSQVCDVDIPGNFLLDIYYCTINITLYRDYRDDVTFPFKY